MQHNPTQSGINEAYQQYANVGLDDAKARLKEKASKVKAVLSAYQANGSRFDGLSELDGSTANDKRDAFRKMNEDALGLKQRIEEIKSVANSANVLDLPEETENNSHVNAILNRGSGDNANSQGSNEIVLTAREMQARNERNLANRIIAAAGFTGEEGEFFRNMVKGQEVKIEGSEASLFYDTSNLISTTGDDTGFSIYPPMTDIVVPGVRPQIRFLDIVRRVMTASNALKYRKQTTTEQLKGATEVARGWKPQGVASTAEANYVWETQTANVEMLFGFTQVTKEQLMDAGGSEELILSNLRMDLRRNMELALLHGSGANEEPTGLFNGATTLAHAEGASSGDVTYGLDFIAQAIYDEIFTDTELMPNFLGFNPIDWRKLITTRDENGNLQFVDPQDVAQQMVFGIPVILSKYTKADSTAGSVLAGNFQEGGALVDRQQVGVENTESHGNNFVAAVTTFRAYARMGVARFYDGAFCTVTGFEGKKVKA